MSSRYSIALLFLLFLGTYKNASSQGGSQRNSPIEFWEITTEDGLSNNWVSAIHQDKHGFVWIGTQYGLNKYDGYNITYYSHDPSDTNSLGGNWVNCISEDKAGNLWLGTQDHGISVFDPRQEKFTRINRKKNGIPRDSPECIFIDESDRKWIGAQGGGLGLLLPGELRFQSFVLPGGPAANHIKSIAPASKSQIWLGTMNGLFLFDIEGKKFTHFPDSVGYRISSLQNEGNDLLWVGTMESGLRVFDTQRRVYLDRETIPQAFDSMAINDITRDGNDVLWLGTNSGLIYFPKEVKGWRLYNEDHLKTSDQVWGIQRGKLGKLWVGTSKGIAQTYANEFRFEQDDYGLFMTEVNSLNTIRAIHQSKDSVLWLGTNEGLFRYDPNAVTPKLEKIVAEVQIFCLLESGDGQIWAGALSGKGVFVIDPSSIGSVEVIGGKPAGEFDQYESVFDMAKGPDGNIWIGTQDLFRYDVKRKELIRLTGKDKHSEGVGRGIILSLIFDRNGNLYLGQSGGGVSLLDHSQLKKKDSLEFENYKHDPSDPQSLSNNSIIDMFLDSKEQLWVGTDAGLNLFHPQQKTFKRYLRKDGLRDDKIMAITEGSEGEIWFSTIGHGLVEFDPEKELFYHHDISSGLRSNAFLLNSVFRNKDGFLWFGNSDGLTGFHPDRLDRGGREFPILLTSIKVNGKELRPGDEGHVISNHVNFVDEIELAPDQNTLTFSFSILNYQMPEFNAYEVCLEGLNSGWQSVGNKNEVTYLNVPAGRYLLKIRGGKVGGRSMNSNCSLAIRIRPYWYKTDWAIVFYILFGLGLVVAIYRFQLKRILEKKEVVRLKEMDEVKGRFYENIVHEFRTPLTLISGPVEQVMEKLGELSPNEIQMKLRLVKANSLHLLSMVNQMTDLSKLESGMLKLNLVQADLIGFLREIGRNFQSQADRNDIEYLIDSQEGSFITNFDPQKLIYIVSNLLTNSFKFTRQGGRITYQVKVSDSGLIIVVEDNGRGIASEDLPMIFDRYFQATSNRSPEMGGSGIGLAFSSELIKLLNGKISVQSQLEAGSRFWVELPLIEEEGEMVDIPSENLNLHFPSENDEDQMNLEKPLILIVEDNWEMAKFTASCLEKEYQIQFASNGEIGTRLAIECIPDIIISDVMMPNKDGIEMCQSLKTFSITSHIPIVLLTAKVAIESRLRGLDKGADVYLDKPFHLSELQLTIRNLLQSREKFRAWFTEFTQLDRTPPGSKEDEKESAFLKKVSDITLMCIKEGLSLDIPELCLQLGISRTQLHRKITALTGYSATHFMNRVRISFAQDLLKETDSTISEIAYQIGFKDPSYFSRTFLKHTGFTPSKYREGLEAK